MTNCLNGFLNDEVEEYQKLLNQIFLSSKVTTTYKKGTFRLCLKTHSQTDPAPCSHNRRSEL